MRTSRAHPRDHEIAWLSWVKTHFKPLEKLGVIEYFSDQNLLGAQDWEARLRDALTRCDLFILLVSPNSLGSNYIVDTEVKAILDRQATNGSTEKPLLLPIMIQPVDDGVLGLFDWLKTPNRRPRDGKALSELSQSTAQDLRTRAMAGIVGEVKKLIENLSDPKVPDPNPTPKSPLIDTSALPDVSLVTLRGRDDELRKLDAAWADPNIHLFSVVAWGGQGKTALVSVWADRLKAEGGRGADAVLAWSFYSQGTKERATSADRFLDWALKKLDIEDPGPSATLKAEAIAEALKDRRVLLILDGVEPLQHGPGPQEGLLKDPAMRILLRRVADGGSKGGLVLVTTRLAVKDIERWKNTAARAVDLMALSETAGAALLADRGVHGTETQLREASRAFGGHALALTLLSGFLVRRHHGDVLQRDLIGPMVAGEREMDQIHGHARRVMKSMDEEWLSQAPLHAAIMRVVGLFDRPANANCLEALHKPPALGGLEAWQAANSDARADAIYDLRAACLLLPEDAQAPDVLDAHPLAREWFGEKLKQENEGGWKAAHGRLYEHLRDTTKEGDTPDMTALEPLFQAIPHGCKAERQQEALNDVYVNRICRRGPDGRLAFYAANNLGAIGPCLAATAWFFDKPFETPHVGLTAADRSWLLGEAARYLGHLGRLGEARNAQSTALEMAITAEASVNAARRAINLFDAEMALGDVVALANAGARSVEWADKSADKTLSLISRCQHAAALAAAGRKDLAQTLFDDAEALQVKVQPEYQRLYSLQGYLFCDFLLSENCFVAVVDRANGALKFMGSRYWVLGLALDNASLGRAALGMALSAATPADAVSHLREASKRLETAVAELRRSNIGIHLPLGHLARARLFRAVGEFDAARRDLGEVLEIAEPGPMRLHLCDMHLELCRLALAELFCFAPLAATPPTRPKDAESLKQTAKAELDASAKFIERCGYRKRDAERDELYEVLAGKRQLRDLPIRV
jgi:TIR domain